MKTRIIIKFSFAVLFSIPVFFLCYCSKPPLAKETIRGFNIKWRALPDFSEDLFDRINRFESEMYRYPGGTVTHKWNWKKGKASNYNDTVDYVHPIKDVAILAQKTSTKIIFVLDIVNSPIEHQIKMLQRSKVPVEYIELGNEIYARNHGYENIYPNGKAYADTVNTWTSKLKAQFPNAKIGAILMGKTADPIEKRQYKWNDLVIANISTDIDAYIFHIYIREKGESVQERIKRFTDAYDKVPKDKETWVTEYGAKNQKLTDLLQLADYVESIADISLNHVLVSAKENYSKLSSDGKRIKKEGKAFIDRLKN